MILTLGLKSAAGHRSMSFHHEMLDHLMVADAIEYAKNKELQQLGEPAATSVKIGFLEDMDTSTEDHLDFCEYGSVGEFTEAILSWYA